MAENVTQPAQPDDQALEQMAVALARILIEAAEVLRQPVVQSYEIDSDG